MVRDRLKRRAIRVETSESMICKSLQFQNISMIHHIFLGFILKINAINGHYRITTVNLSSGTSCMVHKETIAQGTLRHVQYVSYTNTL